MKSRVFWFCVFMGLSIFLIGCTPKEEAPQQKTYIIDNKPPKVIEVVDEMPNAWMEASAEHRAELNRLRSLRELNESEEDFKRMQEMKNVRSVVDGEEIIGYDPKVDNPDLKEVDD